MSELPPPGKKVRIAQVGLGFGAEFTPIYQRHPNATVVALCQRSEGPLNKLADQHGVAGRYTSYEAMLSAGGFDAVHINTGIPDHEEQTVLALQAGFDVACTVPMATTVEGCERICRVAAETGRKYMMMETTMFAREVLWLAQLLAEGKFGVIQHIAAAHPQIMDNWPAYWRAMRPMLYATHVVGPCIALLRKPAIKVVGVASGTVDPAIAETCGSSFARYDAFVNFRDTPVAAHLQRSLFGIAVQYRESVDVSGSKTSFFWEERADSGHHFHNHSTDWAKEKEIPVPTGEVPDFAHLLPESIRHFTGRAAILDAEHRSFAQGGGHGGSHPHLVHAFVEYLRGNRPAWPGARLAANITCTGIGADWSAHNGSQPFFLPAFTLENDKN